MRAVRLVLDMNIATQWVDVLRAAGWDTVHWRTTGDIRAADADILAWARLHARVVLTHDLDFGAILASTKVNAPSVVQFRMQGMLPAEMGAHVIQCLSEYERQLGEGALIVFDERRLRVRMLPLTRNAENS